MQRICVSLFVLLAFMAASAHGGFCENQPLETTAADSASKMDLDQILSKIDTRYNTGGFSAKFIQTSTLKALQITDTATGRLLIKRPSMMRWEYGTPEKQTIISDGTDLWVHRPADNQVMVGAAPAFFGKGKGAGFLADIQSLKNQFDISLVGFSAETAGTEGYYLLKLTPIEKHQDVSVIHIKVIKDVFNIVEIITLNQFEDETRIRLNDIQFDDQIEDALFRFEIPPGVDVFRLDE